MAAKRLIYTNPEKPEAGGSLLRVLKYKSKGYNPTIESLAQIVANLSGVTVDIITEKLREVDPQINPDVNKYSDEETLKNKAEIVVNTTLNLIQEDLKNGY